MNRIAKSKINLYLKVCGKRTDGYHEIETLFVPLESPADQLDFEFDENGKGTLQVSSDCGLPENQDNLCWKAADQTCKALEKHPSIRIFIHKRIPVAAGMGGGSSDAACVINTIQERYGSLPDEGYSIARSCGADVPFFLKSIAAIGRGIGEELIPVPDLWIPPIKIIPMNFPVSAAWAYQHRKIENDSRSLENLLNALKRKDPEQTAANLRNDLAHALWEKFPVLSMVKETLLDAGALGVQITGSGPTLYAVFPDEATKNACRIPDFPPMF